MLQEISKSDTLNASPWNSPFIIPTTWIFKHQSVTPGQTLPQESCICFPVSMPGSQSVCSMFRLTNKERSRPYAGWNGEGCYSNSIDYKGAILKGSPAWMTSPSLGDCLLHALGRQQRAASSTFPQPSSGKAGFHFFPK